MFQTWQEYNSDEKSTESQCDSEDSDKNYYWIILISCLTCLKRIHFLLTNNLYFLLFLMLTIIFKCTIVWIYFGCWTECLFINRYKC